MGHGLVKMAELMAHRSGKLCYHTESLKLSQHGFLAKQYTGPLKFWTGYIPLIHLHRCLYMKTLDPCFMYIVLFANPYEHTVGYEICTITQNLVGVDLISHMACHEAQIWVRQLQTLQKLCVLINEYNHTRTIYLRRQYDFSGLHNDLITFFVNCHYNIQLITFPHRGIQYFILPWCLSIHFI